MSSLASRSVGLPTIVGRFILAETSWILLVSWLTIAIMLPLFQAIIMVAKAVPDIRDWRGKAADIRVDWRRTILLFGFDVKLGVVAMLILVPYVLAVGLGFWS
ncbi:hypothetical protein THAOC_13509, partial [Thalassiosira oceanica]